MMPSAVLMWALMQAPAAAVSLPSSTIALVEAFADGRVNYELTSAKPASMWTPYFPRIKDWQPPPGSLPVTALKLARVLAGHDIRVEVSVLRGVGHQEETAVATFVVAAGAHVIVNELRKFGVEPVDLSLANVAPVTPFLPTVFSVTPNLEIAEVALLTAPYPGYRITVRNLSEKAAANFHVQSYRGTEKALSAIPRAPEGRPTLTPGGSFSFDVNLTSGGKIDGAAWTPTPLDVIEIDSVLWADGSTEGTPATASSLIAPDAGRRTQLTRVVTLLRNALGSSDTARDLLARIRTEIDALPGQDEAQLAVAQTSMRMAKASALEDLTRFERNRSAPPSRAAVMQWLKYTITRYEGWIARLAP